MLAEVSRCIQAITTTYLRTGVHAAESGMKRTEAIILSMTKQERRKPEILNGSRRMRIANGSGVKVVEVNQRTRQRMKMLSWTRGLERLSSGTRWRTHFGADRATDGAKRRWRSPKPKAKGEPAGEQYPEGIESDGARTRGDGIAAGDGTKAAWERVPVLRAEPGATAPSKGAVRSPRCDPSKAVSPAIVRR